MTASGKTCCSNINTLISVIKRSASATLRSGGRQMYLLTPCLLQEVVFSAELTDSLALKGLVINIQRCVKFSGHC